MNTAMSNEFYLSLKTDHQKRSFCIMYTTTQGTGRGLGVAALPVRRAKP